MVLVCQKKIRIATEENVTFHNRRCESGTREITLHKRENVCKTKVSIQDNLTAR